MLNEIESETSCFEMDSRACSRAKQEEYADREFNDWFSLQEEFDQVCDAAVAGIRNAILLWLVVVAIGWLVIRYGGWYE
jgi:ribose/xylose/arabinose/galactoside ABC-type transport system permease subunit